MQSPTPLARLQRGFTLVEIMVALVIALILIGGVTQIFTGNRESYRVQSGMATLQENARVAMEILARDISMAGFPATLGGKPFTAMANGPGGDSDTFGVQYQTDTDCLGNTLVGPTMSIHLYSVQDIDGDGVSSLYCAPNGATPTALVDGIDAMQILYGLDLTGPAGSTDGYPDRYMTAPVTDDSRIVAVRVALLVNSIEPVLRQTDTSTYALLDAERVGPYTDRRGRRLFFTTILIRNKFGQT